MSASSSILNLYLTGNFQKWKVIEDCENYYITVRVKGPINLLNMCLMGNVFPRGVKVDFYTMGFWEALFSKKANWVTK